MAELRTDWLTGRSVIVAENRALRPNEFSQRESTPSAQGVAQLALAEAGLSEVTGVPDCPFCVGSESKTPPAVYEKLDLEGHWQVRVVPNMFPAVTFDAVATIGSSVGTDPGQRLDSAPAHGAHEVIVESARHADRMSALSIVELRLVLDAYADRLSHYRADGRFGYGLVFKNQGSRAGASLAHLHSQFVALPAAPPAVGAEMDRAADEWRRRRACAYCRLMDQERSFGERIVLHRDGFIAFCPFASLQPHEIWLMPERHEPWFEQARGGSGLDRLADVLHTLVARIERTVPDAAFNLLLRSAPWQAHCDKWCHWRIEVVPRVNALAGFEFATGIHINPLAPEGAARQLWSA